MQPFDGAADGAVEAGEKRDAATDVRHVFEARPALPSCPEAPFVESAAPVDAAASDGGQGVATMCTRGWCRAAHVPTNWTLRGVWGSSDDDVWVAGGTASLLHWDGTSWSSVNSGGSGLFTIWGSSRDDVWAAGYQSLVHWDGAQWKAPAPLLVGQYSSLSIAGSGPDDVWVTTGLVLQDNNAERWDGHTWTWAHVPDLILWSAGPKDVWAVGAAVSHFDGVRWTTDTSLGPQKCVWGSGPNDVWVGGAGIKRWDGARWSPSLNASTAVSAIWGTGPADVWAATDQSILHWDGTAWSKSVTSKAFIGSAIWAFADDDVWVAVGAEIDHWDGVDWTPSPTPPGTPNISVQRFAAAGRDDLWALDWGNELLHWNGSAWSIVPSGTTETLSVVWAAGPSDAWAAGVGVLLRWNGTAWSADPSGADVDYAAVWGTGPQDVWTVGTDWGGNAVVRHWDGQSWADRTPPCNGSSRFSDIWGAAPDDVWMIDNDQGAFLHWDGVGWTFPAMNAGRLVRVTGERTDDVWAFSEFDDGVYHWDGVVWRRDPTAPSQLRDIHVLGPDDAWGIGRFGLARWDGVSWFAPGPNPTLAGWSQPGGSSWAVGDSGQILRRRP